MMIKHHNDTFYVPHFDLLKIITMSAVVTHPTRMLHDLPIGHSRSELICLRLPSYVYVEGRSKVWGSCFCIFFCSPS